jgi:hypothetical protein
MIDSLTALEQALPLTLLERCVIVGPAAVRLALMPFALIHPTSAPRITLAVTHDDWEATAVAVSECLAAEGWQAGRIASPDGVMVCPSAGHWPIEFIHEQHWRSTLVLAGGLSELDRASQQYRWHSNDILLPTYPAGDVAVHAPVQFGAGRVRFADPTRQVLADLLACASTLARERVEVRDARAAHALGLANLLPPATVESMREAWTTALQSTGYPADATLQLVSSSLVDTLERTSTLHLVASALFGEIAPTPQAFAAAQGLLLKLVAR